MVTEEKVMVKDQGLVEMKAVLRSNGARQSKRLGY